MTPQTPNSTCRRIRENAPNRRSVSLTDIDIDRLSSFEKNFTIIYTEDVPFSFSKTVSKAIELALLMVSDPKLRALEEESYQRSNQKSSQILRRIREKAPHRRSVSLTDTDIQRISCLEKTFTTIYTGDTPFSFSKTVSKSIDLAYLMVFDSGMLFNTEESIHKMSNRKLSEEQKEQLKYIIENGVVYKVLMDRKLLTDEDSRYLKAILSFNGGILFPTIPEFEFPIYSYRDILNFQ